MLELDISYRVLPV